MPPRKSTASSSTSSSPATRASSRPRTRQSTLSFGHKSARISKPSAGVGKNALKVPGSASAAAEKARSLSPAARKEVERATSTGRADAEHDDDDDEVKEKEKDVEVEEKDELELAEEEEKKLPGAKTGSKNVVKPLDAEGAATEDEVKARKIDKPMLEKYHKDILAARLCKPLHQQELTLEEKILRHFDLSSQYGPCIGISRLDRWKRAQKLGLQPPIEVLAVALMMEDDHGGNDKTRDTRIAYIDDYLSTRVVVE